MPITEDSLEYEFYKDQIETPTIEEEKPIEAETPVVEEEKPVVAEVVEEKPIVAEVVTTPTPEADPTPKRKYVPIEDEKALYDTLARKYAYDSMKPEEKAFAFIARENPGLSDEDLMFIAASDYGIGVEKPDETEMTDEQLHALRKQDIARKRLLSQADTYFKEEAGRVELTGIDPLDSDEGYKTYQQAMTAQAEQQRTQQETYNNTIQQIESNSKQISEIKESVEIDIDEGKLTLDVSFKLDADKQKQLADYIKQYNPSEAEVAQFTDTPTGKFDWKGYIEAQATKVFAKQIMQAGIRQALATDRQKFVEETLKNSTLRNNDVSKVVTKDFDLVDVWPMGR